MPGPNIVTQDLLLRNRHVSLCQFLQLSEENIRFLLLALFLYIYLCMGAFIFQAVEESTENQIRINYETLYNDFIKKLNLLNEDAGAFTNNNNNNNNNNNGGIDHHEHDDEQQQQQQQQQQNFINETQLLKLLYIYGNASKAGVFTRKRWDWVGSFHFAWTIVSTIGYGVTSPTTTPGQLLIIPYGFFGCAGGLLFFNLFLERIITFLSTCMRYYRIQRQKRRYYIYGGGTNVGFTNPPSSGSGGGGGGTTTTTGRRGSHSSIGNGSTTTDESDWKPSVYWVMICLFFMSGTIICGSASIFHVMEGWTYIESLYFCFVSYATIGFGDFVSMQLLEYGNFELIYRVGAFTLMVLGCCCIYSLLNVMSIVIKQSLNWLIKKMDDWHCCSCCYCLTRTVRRNFSVKRISSRRRNNNRRNINPKTKRQFQVAVLKMNHHHHTSGSSTSGGGGGGNERNSSNDETNQQQQQYNINNIDMEDRGIGGERRYSGENMISLRSELNNKVSLAVMQKRLYETAQLSRCTIVPHDNDFSARSVGPLAIVTEKFEDNHS